MDIMTVLRLNVNVELHFLCHKTVDMSIII